MRTRPNISLAVAVALHVWSAAFGYTQPVVLTLETWAGPGTGTRDVIDNIVAGFHEAQPNIRIEVAVRPDTLEAIVVKLATGTAADIMMMNGGVVRVRESLTDLQPYLDKSEINVSDFLPGTFEPLEGKLYAIPFWADATLLYYNVEMFNAAGLVDPNDYYRQGIWHWEEALEVARKLTRDTSGDGETDQWGFAFRDDWWASMFARQNGGSLISADGTTYTGNRPEFTDAIQWYADWWLVHGVQNGPKEHLNHFWSGNRGMTPYGSGGRSWLLNNATFEWNVAPLFRPRNAPAVERAPGTGGGTHGAGSGLVIPQSTVNKEAAWTFLEYWMSFDGQSRIALSQGSLPYRISVLQSEFFRETASPSNFMFAVNEALQVPVETVPRYVPEGDTLNSLFQQAVSHVSAGRKSAVEAFEEIAGVIQSHLDRVRDQIIVQ